MTTDAPIIDLSERRRRVDALVKEHRAWAISITRSVGRGSANCWASDAESAALLALWQMARKWDGRGNFRAFAHIRVKGAVIDEYRQLTHRRRGNAGPRGVTVLKCACQGTDANCPKCAGTGHPLPPRPVSIDLVAPGDIDRAQPEPDDTAERVAEVRLLMITTRLSDHQVDVVLRSLAGETLAAIGASWGTTEGNACCRAMGSARRKLAAARKAADKGGDAA